jgi:hypothetical protein
VLVEHLKKIALSGQQLAEHDVGSLFDACVAVMTIS